MLNKTQKRNLAVAKLDKLRYYLEIAPLNGHDLSEETIDKVDSMLHMTILSMMDMDDLFQSYTPGNISENEMRKLITGNHIVHNEEDGTDSIHDTYKFNAKEQELLKSVSTKLKK